MMANSVIDTQVLDLSERAAMALGELGATVEPMDDDLEPVEPIWFAYARALWNARFRDALPQWHDKLSPTLIRQMELGKDTTGEAVGRALLGPHAAVPQGAGLVRTLRRDRHADA